VKKFHKILIIIILQLICFQQILCAQDTVTVANPVKEKISEQDTSKVDKHLRKKFKPETMRATMLAVSFPGLGQIYNRKVWKIPVVYAGFGALIYSAGFNGKNYTLYMKAYQDFTDNVLATDSYLKVIDPKVPRDTYDKLFNPTGYNASSESYYREGMLRMVDYYKRYRDLSYIGIAGWYLISILDANVDASLFNYDVSPNLNITFAPVQMNLPGGFMGAGLCVDMKVNF
jgi:hypothetical protein